MEAKSMVDRIQYELESDGKEPWEIQTLDLSKCKATEIQGLTNEFENLENLSLSQVGLTTLKGFPALPNLKRLDLSDNAITGTLDLLAGSPDLSHLNLSGNKIKDLETVKPLEKLTQLESLALARCDVSKKGDYREKIFELIPSLRFLDGRDKDRKKGGVWSMAPSKASEGEEGGRTTDRFKYLQSKGGGAMMKAMREKAAAKGVDVKNLEEDDVPKPPPVKPVKPESEDKNEETKGEGEEGDEVPEDEDEISDEEDGAEGQNNHAGKKHAEEDEDGEDD